MLSVFMLSVFLLSVFMLSVLMLNVVAPILDRNLVIDYDCMFRCEIKLASVRSSGSKTSIDCSDDHTCPPGTNVIRLLTSAIFTFSE
jgi:hypothetical protein